MLPVNAESGKNDLDVETQTWKSKLESIIDFSFLRKIYIIIKLVKDNQNKYWAIWMHIGDDQYWKINLRKMGTMY